MKKQQYARPNRHGLILGLLLVLTFPFPAKGDEKVLAQQAAMLERVVLRQNVMVDNNLILLGDLFKGTGDKATIAVAYAPEPGK